MTVRVNMLSGIGWMLFHNLHEQHSNMPGEEFVKLFEKTHHCRVGYAIKETVEGGNPMKYFYMEFTPEQFTLFQLKYSNHPQKIDFDYMT